jgi:hypothetical protein
MAEKTKSKNLDATIKVLTSIMQKQEGFVRHLDIQINILLGICSGVFLMSVSQLKTSNFSLAFVALAFFSATACVVCLCAIHPPKIMRKRGQKESIMYNKKIAAHSSSSEYTSIIKKSLASYDRITEQYSVEIYNLCKFYYRPKRKLFHIARIIFFTGIAFSLVIILSESYIAY